MFKRYFNCHAFKTDERTIFYSSKNGHDGNKTIETLRKFCFSGHGLFAYIFLKVNNIVFASYYPTCVLSFCTFDIKCLWKVLDLCVNVKLHRYNMTMIFIIGVKYSFLNINSFDMTFMLRVS